MDLDADVFPCAERASDAGERDAHELLRQVEARSDLLPVDVQPLRRDEEVDPAVARRNGEPTLGSERRLVLHSGLVVAVDPHVGRSGVEVAVGDVHVAQHVAEVVQAPCAWIERELHVGERLERLVVDADQTECGTCALGAVGGHERDGFALVAHLVAGQHRLIGDLEAERGAAGDVRGGQDGVHARRDERL